VLSAPHTSISPGRPDALTRAHAAEIVVDAASLTRAVSLLLADARLRTKRAQCAARTAAAGLGTLDAVLDRLAPWLEPVGPARPPSSSVSSSCSKRRGWRLTSSCAVMAADSPVRSKSTHKATARR